MKLNYEPWVVDISDFYNQKTNEDRMRFLLKFAVLAPSSHNSQPWRFKVDDCTIWISVETSRRLTDSDKNDRQLFLSLGCAITNILTAADYYGFKEKVTYFPNFNDFTCAAKIEFESGTTRRGVPDHLIFDIPKRVNNRKKYLPEVPDRKFLSRIDESATAGLKITIVTNAELKDQLADIAVTAGISAMEDAAFRNELSHYIKSNVTDEKIGMPAYGMSIPTPISFLAPSMIKYLNMAKLGKKDDTLLLKKFTPAIGIISTQADDKGSWLKAGEMYEKIALLATHYGVKTAVLGAPIQIGNYYEDIQDIIHETWRPQFFFRMGYTDEVMPHSPRLSASEVEL